MPWIALVLMNDMFRSSSDPDFSVGTMMPHDAPCTIVTEHLFSHLATETDGNDSLLDSFVAGSRSDLAQD